MKPLIKSNYAVPSGSLRYRDTSKPTFVPELLPRHAHSLSCRRDEADHVDVSREGC
jgi:hypothetical protein